MDIDIINTIIKCFSLNLFTFIIFFKISNKKIDKIKICQTLISGVFLTIVYIILKKNTDNVIAILILYFLQSIILKKIFNFEISNVMIIAIISVSISYFCFIISGAVEFNIQAILNIDSKSRINFLLISIIESILIYAFFKIKRFRNGFAFLQNKKKNDYLDIIMINISALVILAYCIFGNYYGDSLTKCIFFTFIMVGIIMIIMIQKTLILNYKQKLFENTINDYENKIKEKDSEIEKLRFDISKTTHEFYNRQKALEMMVKNTNIEAGKEIATLDRIENLTQEYSEKLKKVAALSKLQATNISEIDEMFKYMQSECYKNNIEFKLKVVSDVSYLTNNIIAKNKFETLIGDHLRDAIIAITSSTNKNREILVIIGIKDKSYELSIYDTGIEFDLEVLQKLGLEPITTHKETGGSGFGFITTFETLKECKGSLIIEEKHKITNNDFTKAIIIRFDGRNEYKIKSYRADEIRKLCNSSNRIIENLQ